MKKIVSIFSAIAIIFSLTSFVAAKKEYAPKIDVTVDFTGYSDGNTVTFVDDKGKVTVFNSANGLVQVKQMKEGDYTVTWSLSPSTQSSCQIFFSYLLAGDPASLPEAPGSATFSGVPVGANVGGSDYFSFAINCR